MKDARSLRTPVLALMIFLLAGALVMPQSPVRAASNVLVNGDFEQGWGVGWTESSAQGWAVVWDTASWGGPAAHSGNWLGWLGGDNYETAYLMQVLTLSPGTHLSFWYWIESYDSGCGNDLGFLRINGINVDFWQLCTSANTNGWVQYTMDLSPYGGQTVALEVRVTTNYLNTSSLYVDDFTFYKTFADVPFGYWAEAYIQSLYSAGITGGCSTSPLSYCPASPVTRAQMAVFLLKGMYGASYTPPAASGTVFNDVPVSHWAAAWIERLAKEGITAGCGAGNYCPDYSVTRDQMAIFLLRAKHGSAYQPPAVGASTGFTDVPVSYWAAAWIKQLAVEGITGGCAAGTYCPTAPVTRDQMAVFLQRVFSLPLP